MQITTVKFSSTLLHMDLFFRPYIWKLSCSTSFCLFALNLFVLNRLQWKESLAQPEDLSRRETEQENVCLLITATFVQTRVITRAGVSIHRWMEKESKEKVKREPKCLLIQHWALILAGKERERHMQSELAIFPGTRTTSASFSDKRGLPQRATPVQITFYSWQLLTTIPDTIMFFESNQSRAICKENFIYFEVYLSPISLVSLKSSGS